MNDEDKNQCSCSTFLIPKQKTTSLFLPYRPDPVTADYIQHCVYLDLILDLMILFFFFSEIN